MLGLSSQVHQYPVVLESPVIGESSKIPDWGCSPSGGGSLTGTRACYPGPYTDHLCHGYNGTRAAGGRDGQI